MKVIDRLLKILDIPITLLMWLGLAGGFLMMMHVSADVAGRTVFNRPITGTTEVVAAYYMVAVAYLPWAWIARSDGHIMVELFTRKAHPRVIAGLDLGVKLLALVYVTVFSWQTALRATQQTRAGEVWEAAGGFIAVWPSRWILPLAGGLMALYLLLRIARDLLIARRG